MDASTSAGWYPDPWGTHDLRYWDGAAWTHHVSAETLEAERADQAPAADTEDSLELAPSPLEPDAKRPTSLIVFAIAVAAIGAVVVILLLTLPQNDEDAEPESGSPAISRECMGAAQSVSGDEFAATGPADLVPIFNACTTEQEWVGVAGEYPELAGDAPVRWARRQCQLVAELEELPLCLALSESG